MKWTVDKTSLYCEYDGNVFAEFDDGQYTELTTKGYLPCKGQDLSPENIEILKRRAKENGWEYPISLVPKYQGIQFQCTECGALKTEFEGNRYSGVCDNCYL